MHASAPSDAIPGGGILAPHLAQHQPSAAPAGSATATATAAATATAPPGAVPEMSNPLLLQTDVDSDGVPKHFLCPITQEVFDDPVIWVGQGGRSPTKSPKSFK